jgi:PGF-pre-PGF domain-containing protein
MKSRIVTAMFVFLLAVSVAQAQSSVSRNLPDSAVTAGTSFTVEIAVTVAAGTTYYAIDELVPTGLSASSATGGGDTTSQAGHVKWVVVENATSATYTYTVSVPVSASGQFTFGPGEYQFEGQASSAPIGGDSALQVVPPTQPDFTLTASPASIAVPRNSSRTVTIDIGQIAGYNQVVTLAALGVPNGTTPSFSPTSGTAPFTSTLTLAASPAAPLGPANIVIRGTGADNKQRNVTIQMNVTIPPVCGNSLKEAGEDCDGTALGGATCASVAGTGSTGTLSCTASCTFNTSACVAPTAQPTCSVQQDIGTCTLASASSGQDVEWELDQPSKLGVTALEVTTSASASNIQLTLQRLPGKPATAPDLSPVVYQYYTISENNLPNSKIASAAISFAVNKSWLSANNVQAGSVKLNRLVNNTWQALTTTKTSEDSSFAYYRAPSPGFAVFGVNGAATAPQCPQCPSDSTGACEIQPDGSGKQNVTTYTCGPQTDFKCEAASAIQGCCPTCPPAGAFGACSPQGQQTRTVYQCSAQTSFKCEQRTESQTCVSQEIAGGFISQAQSDIRTADGQGKDVTAAQDLLAQSQAALTAGNYEQARSLAQQASVAANTALPRPFPLPGGPAALIAILVIAAIVIIAIVLRKKGIGRGPAKNRCYIGGEETVLGLKCTVCMQRICIRHARAHGGRIYCERHVPKA